MLNHNIKGFIDIMQNPDNLENQRAIAKNYLEDLVERLRKIQYKEHFRQLLTDVMLDFEKSSIQICHS